MQWDNGSVFVDHPRQPWNQGGGGDTLVHCKLETMKGTDPALSAQKATLTSAYAQAKKHFAIEIAFEIVERCVRDQSIDALADLVVNSTKPVIFIFPHVSFDDEDGDSSNGTLDRPSNALPFAFARFLAEKCGVSVNETIIQVARIGRTRLPKWVRFLCQPSFDGAIETNAAYVVVDDVISTGGTFAALRSYIVRNGGTVLGTMSLANSDGLHQKFAIADQTVNMLISAYGPELNSYWARTFGHDIANLTEAEGRFLLGAVNDGWAGSGTPVLQHLRERINQAAAKFG